MVRSGSGAGAIFVSRRSARIRQAWLRIGVWLFIFVFAFSIVGGLLAGGIFK